MYWYLLIGFWYNVVSSRLDEVKREPLNIDRSRKGWEGEDISNVSVMVGRRVLKVVKNSEAERVVSNMAKMSSM